MKKIARVLAPTLLSAFIFTLLSACGGGSAEDETGTGGSANKDGFGYVASAKPLELPKEYVGFGSELCFDGERLYFSAYKEKQVPSGKFIKGSDEEILYYVSETGLLSMLPDGSDLREIEGYEPLKPEGSRDEMFFSNSIRNLRLTPDGNLLFVEQSTATFYKTGYEDGEYLNVSNIRLMSKDGREIARLGEEELKKANEEAEFYYPENLIVAPDGKIAVLCSGEKMSLMVFNGELKQPGRIELEKDGWIDAMGLSRKGEVFVLQISGEGKRGLSRIDFEGGSLKPYEKENNNFFNMISDADDEFDLFTVKGAQSVFGLDIETGEDKYLFNWLELGIDSNSGTFQSLGNGRYVALTSSRTEKFAKHLSSEKDKEEEEGKCELLIVEKKPLSEIPERKVLTLACIYLNRVDSSAVAKFNKTNPNARIVIKDYSVYDTENDYKAGITKLTTELTAGNIPDMICENYDLPLRNLGDKGMLIDLLPFIEKDKELGPDCLFEPVLKLILNKGKLYTAYTGFVVSTAVAPAGVFENGSVGLKESEEALKKLKPGATFLGTELTAESYVHMALMGMNKFVDWKEGKAHFDGEDFLGVLNLAKKLPAEIDWSKKDFSNMKDPRERFVQGEQLFCHSNIMVNNDELRALYKLTDGKIAFTGLPGVGSSIITTNGGISITTACKNTDIAWEYVRQRLLDDGFGELEDREDQNRLWIADKGRWSLPLNKKPLERYFKSQMTAVNKEDGKEKPHGEVNIGYANMIKVELFAMSEAERGFFMSAFDNCVLGSFYDEGLNKIIQEELSPFLKGAKSAEETAKIIQNRASIYVSEHS